MPKMNKPSTSSKLVDMAIGSAKPKDFVNKFSVMMGSKVASMLSKERNEVAKNFVKESFDGPIESADSAISEDLRNALKDAIRSIRNYAFKNRTKVGFFVDPDALDDILYDVGAGLDNDDANILHDKIIEYIDSVKYGETPNWAKSL